MFDPRPPPIFPARESTQPSLPPLVSGSSGSRLCRRPTAVLRHAGRTVRPQRLCPLPGPLKKERLGSLRQSSVRRTATGVGVSGPLHPSRGHQQSTSASTGGGAGFLRLERLPRSRDEGDDGDRRRVHPALTATLPAHRVTAHPLLRLPGQLSFRVQTPT